MRSFVKGRECQGAVTPAVINGVRDLTLNSLFLPALISPIVLEG